MVDEKRQNNLPKQSVSSVKTQKFTGRKKCKLKMRVRVFMSVVCVVCVKCSLVVYSVVKIKNVK